jgi:hypothetical protein
MAVNPSARVCYVDNDPMAVVHIRALMTNEPGVTAAGLDLATPASVLVDPDVTASISLTEPACVILASVLHFFDPARAREITSAYISRLAPGSAVVISSLRSDDPSLFGQVSDQYTAAPKIYNFTRGEMGSFLGGLDLVPPGVVRSEDWNGGDSAPPPREPGRGYVLGGVGLKPSGPRA